MTRPKLPYQVAFAGVALSRWMKAEDSLSEKLLRVRTPGQPGASFGFLLKHPRCPGFESTPNPDSTLAVFLGLKNTTPNGPG